MQRFHPKSSRRKLFAGLFFIPSVLVACIWFSFSPKVFADEPGTSGGMDWVYVATNHLGLWIWETNATDKQTVCFLKNFELPKGRKISSATLRVSVDNGYTLFLDGAEIGRGSDWRTVTLYDVTQLLAPGQHTLAVEGFNDRLEGGLIMGLVVQFSDGTEMSVVSDKTWRVVPTDDHNWAKRKINISAAHPVLVVGGIGKHPWEKWPFGLATVPPLRPQVLHFWQRGWFQLSLLALCLLALLFSLWLAARLAAQSKAQELLQVERARIARDIHDDLGAQLTQLLLLSEVARREQPENSGAHTQFNLLCERARELATALDEVVWAVNSRRDTVRDFTSYVCKYAQVFLGASSIRCRLDVESEIPTAPFDLPVRRNLFLAVKEALNNAAKYSAAEELFLRIYRRDQKLIVAVEDNGRGFDSNLVNGEGNGLTNMAQRMAEIGGTCAISSQPGGGCLVAFTVPLPAQPRRWFRRAPSEYSTGKTEAPRPGE